MKSIVIAILAALTLACGCRTHRQAQSASEHTEETAAAIIHRRAVSADSRVAAIILGEADSVRLVFSADSVVGGTVYRPRLERTVAGPRHSTALHSEHRAAQDDSTAAEVITTTAAATQSNSSTAAAPAAPPLWALLLLAAAVVAAGYVFRRYR